MWRLAKKLYFILAILIGLLIVFKSIEYIYPRFDRGFLLNKEDDFTWYKYFLYGHAIGSPIALFCGLFQFSFTRSNLHKIVGKIYLISILVLAAPGALIMSFYAIGGAITTSNFLLMTFLWAYFSYKAYSEIRKGDIKQHETFMIRSFILTNSAIWIRILSYFNHHYQLMDIELGYVLITFLSWIPALLIYETTKTLKFIN